MGRLLEYDGFVIADTVNVDWAIGLHALIVATVAFAVGRTSLSQSWAIVVSLVVAFGASLGWRLLSFGTDVAWREMFDPRELWCNLALVRGVAPKVSLFSLHILLVWGGPALLAYVAIRLRRRWFPSPSWKSRMVLGLGLVLVAVMLLLTVRFSFSGPLF